MQEVRETKVLKVNLDSPIFNNVKETLNEKIIESIKKVYDEEFESGDITLKITLAVPEVEREIPMENENGDPVVKIIEYKALSFKHNITTTFKKVDKEEDTYFSDKGLVEDEDGNFIEKAIGNPQVSLFD